MADQQPTPSDFGDLVERVSNVERTQQDIKTALAENTAITLQIKEGLIVAKWVKRLAVGIVALIVTTSTLVTTWHDLADKLWPPGKK